MKRFGIFAALTAAVLLTGCSAATYEGFTLPEEERTLTPVGALTREVSYEDIAPAEKTQAPFRSAESRSCTIRPTLRPRKRCTLPIHSLSRRAR